MTIAEQMNAAIPTLRAAADSDAEDLVQLSDAAAVVAELLLSMRDMDRNAWADVDTSAAFAELEPILKRLKPRLERLRERVAFSKA